MITLNRLVQFIGEKSCSKNLRWLQQPPFEGRGLKKCDTSLKNHFKLKFLTCLKIMLRHFSRNAFFNFLILTKKCQKCHKSDFWPKKKKKKKICLL